MKGAKPIESELTGQLPNPGREGIALVPTMLMLSGLAIVLMALMTSVMSGKRTTNHQNDDFKLSSAVEKHESAQSLGAPDSPVTKVKPEWKPWTM